jgi:hypothetical protein
LEPSSMTARATRLSAAAIFCPAWLISVAGCRAGAVTGPATASEAQLKSDEAASTPQQWSKFRRARSVRYYATIWLRGRQPPRVDSVVE